MCGRYTLIADGNRIARSFDVDDSPPWQPRYNLAPGQAVPAVRVNPHRNVRELTFLNWGLVPFWAREPSIGYRMINARAESAAQKPAFRAPMRHHRCLIPATGFYEWRHDGGGERHPYYFCRADSELFAFAGIADHWAHADGSEIESCAILTLAANRLVATVHPRMPAVIAPADYALWLDPEQQRPQALRSLLQAWDPDAWTIRPVDPRVNKTGVDDPGLIAPCHTTDIQSDFLGRLGV